MSIYGALFSGVSGLAAQAQAMGMLSDNITNVNTVGYKETTARFSTLVTSSATTTAYAPGGVRSTPLQLIDKQGLLTSSVSPTDLAGLRAAPGRRGTDTGISIPLPTT